MASATVFSGFPRALKSNYPWLAFSEDAFLLDLKLGKMATDVAATEPITKYDYYQYERLLSDISGLLDRCLSYRREYMELAASAIRQALEYDLFQRQLSSSKELDEASWMVELKRLDALGQGTVAKEFENIKEDEALAGGFESAAAAARDLAGHTVTAEHQRIALVQQKWRILEDHQRKMDARHRSPGHPYNYAERAGRVLAFLLEDFHESLEKACVASTGLDKILHWNLGRRWLYPPTEMALSTFAIQ